MWRNALLETGEGSPTSRHGWLERDLKPQVEEPPKGAEAKVFLRGIRYTSGFGKPQSGICCGGAFDNYVGFRSLRASVGLSSDENSRPLLVENRLIVLVGSLLTSGPEDPLGAKWNAFDNGSASDSPRCGVRLRHHRFAVPSWRSGRAACSAPHLPIDFRTIGGSRACRQQIPTACSSGLFRGGRCAPV